MSVVFCCNRAQSKLGWLGVQILRTRFRKTRFAFSKTNKKPFCPKLDKSLPNLGHSC